MSDTASKNAKRPASTLRGQNRLRLVVLGFAACFLAIGGKASYISLMAKPQVKTTHAADDKVRLPRPDIVDRNGIVLATDIPVESMFVDPSKVIDVDDAIERLTAVSPDLNPRILRKKLSNRNRRFVWLKREVGPTERTRLHDQGVPGVGFRKETRRFYPAGKLAAHVLGFVDVDSRGLAGIEKFLDDQGALFTASLAKPDKAEVAPAQLSIDIRVQHALADEIGKAVTYFKAKAGAGVILDATTGEIIALASLPDFNPNEPSEALSKDRINRITKGVFELGSVIKAVTFAMAFDAGVMTMESRYDARSALVVGRSWINDFHAKKRILTVPEVFLYSSNIGTAKMALDVGQDAHQAFLRKVGLLNRLKTEVPESSAPIVPRRWSKITTVTASYGHGFAVQPLQGVAVTAALVNGGLLLPPTFLKRDKQTLAGFSKRIISAQTSEKMRYLFRLNAIKGTARKADQQAKGYRLGGKTGTAEKVINGVYSKNHRLTSFVGAFPMDAPKYVVMVMLDEPQPLPETHNYATSGWNAVPTAGKIVARIAPLLNVAPYFDPEKGVKEVRAKAN